jgi:hypothetical protein
MQRRGVSSSWHSSILVADLNAKSVCQEPQQVSGGGPPALTHVAGAELWWVFIDSFVN